MARVSIIMAWFWILVMLSVCHLAAVEFAAVPYSKTGRILSLIVSSKQFGTGILEHLLYDNL